MDKKIKIISLLLGVTILSFIVGAFILAWTEPTVLPPDGNVDAPINVGIGTQRKAGALGIGGVFEAESLAIFRGNVGIGTTGPADRFHIRGGHNDSRFRLEAHNAPNPPAHLAFWASEPGISWAGTGIGNNVTWQHTAGSWGPRLIDTTHPGSYIRFYRDTTRFGTVNTANIATERMIIDAAGNVGIGTAGPTTALTVHAVGPWPTGWGPGIHAWDLYAGGTIAAGTGGALNAWMNRYGHAFFAGNVGIGTTAPGHRLDVVGAIRAQGADLRTTGNTGWLNETHGGGWFMQDATWIRTHGGRSVWTGGGLLGSDGGLTVGYGGHGSPAGGAIIAGNVGIGTAAPTHRLTVAGQIRATEGTLIHECPDLLGGFWCPRPCIGQLTSHTRCQDTRGGAGCGWRACTAVGRMVLP